MSISVVANPRKATTITAATTAAKAVLVGKNDDDLGLFPIMLTIGRRLITSLKLYTQPFVKLLKIKRHVIQGRETGAKCKAISQTEKKKSRWREYLLCGSQWTQQRSAFQKQVQRLLLQISFSSPLSHILLASLPRQGH